MQKVLPGMLLVFGLATLTLFSDMVGVSVRKIRNQQASPGAAPFQAIPPTPPPDYQPGLLRGNIPPH